MSVTFLCKHTHKNSSSFPHTWKVKVFLNSYVNKDFLLNKFKVFGSDARMHHIVNRERNIEK